MTLSKKDRPKVFYPMAMLAGSLLLAGVIAYLGGQFTKKMGDRELATERKFSEVASRLSSVRQERMDIDTYASLYRQLLRRGVAAEFHRVDLVDRIASVNSRAALFDLRYTIAPQRKIATPSWNAEVNRADFEFSVLHEQQLLDFIESLRSQTRGLSVIEGCSVDRVGQERQIAYLPQLKAKCALAWVTLTPGGGK